MAGLPQPSTDVCVDTVVTMARADQADTEDRWVGVAVRAPSRRYHELVAVRPQIERRVQVMAVPRQVFIP